MDTRALFVAAGEALFRESWKGPLAAALSVSERRLRRWMQTGDIPPGVWKELHQMLIDRHAELRRCETLAMQIASLVRAQVDPPPEH
jgi:hypothetical protein